MQQNYYSFKKESDFASTELSKIEKYLAELENEIRDNSDDLEAQSLDEIDGEILNVQKQIETEISERLEIQRRTNLWKVKLQQSLEEQEEYNQKINQLQMTHKELQDDLHSVNDEIDRHHQTLDKLMQVNIINDAFYIWYAGPYGTINNFRLGNSPLKPIEFSEINAALGETAFVIHLIASRCKLDFKQYQIIPMGSFPKIYKSDDRNKSLYPLYIDQSSFSFFPKRNFNFALNGFMSCIQELGDYVAFYDPTMTMPYKINLHDSKIGEVSFVYGVDDEIWTRSLKFMLSNVKWIIAWYTKHGKTININATSNSTLL